VDRQAYTHLVRLVNSERHLDCIAHFRYRGSIECRRCRYRCSSFRCAQH